MNDQLDADLLAHRARVAEDNERQALKERGDYLYARRRAQGLTITDSADPTTGLQPAVSSHDAWPYRPVVSRTVAGLPPYQDQKQRDLAEERRVAEGERFVPRCTGCLARLDPQWCGNIADDDRDAR